MPSTEKGLAEQPVKIADLYSKCSELAVEEEKEMSRVVGTVLPVLAYLNEPVALRPGSLGGSFAELQSVSLGPGAVVTTIDSQGIIASRPLAELRTGECLAVLMGAFPEMQRMIADKKRDASARPAISMKLFRKGQRFIVDRRTYHLLVSNSGADCKEMRISVELADGRRKSSKGRDLSRGGQIELDLGLRDELDGAQSISLRLECEGVDGRQYSGAESLRLDGESLQEVPLSRSPPVLVGT
ncbi:MAG TPA: hypothetical protein VGS04_05960 [Nitrososphaerales archaeon]|nr:hypothetical protein [Nitrososphaerales archaeon]